MIELGLEALDFLEGFTELGTGNVPLQLWHIFWRAGEALGGHEVIELLHGGAELFNDGGGGIDEPDFLTPVLVFAGEELDGFIDPGLLLTEVEDVPVGFGVIEDAVSAGEGLNEAVVFQVLIDVEGIEILGVKAGEEHVYHDGEIDLMRGGLWVGGAEIGEGEALRLDSVLYVLVVGIEVGDAVIGAVA